MCIYAVLARRSHAEVGMSFPRRYCMSGPNICYDLIITECSTQIWPARFLAKTQCHVYYKVKGPQTWNFSVNDS